MKRAIEELLAEKQTIDSYRRLTNNLASYDGWLPEAVELLLRIALEQEVDHAASQ